MTPFRTRAVTILTGAVAMAMLAAACGGGGTPGSEADGPTTTAASENLCIAPTYEVEAPEGWAANDPAEASPCRFFNPEPFEVPVDTEPVGIAILLGYENVPFDAAASPSPQVAEVVDTREETVDELPARRLHLRSTGEALLDKGTEYVTWLIKMGERRHFAATTIQQNDSFVANVEALDAMVDTIDFKIEIACSAAGMDKPPAPEELPAPVLEKREQILDAATACDFERLAEIAGAHEHFTYSFGDEADFRVFLTDAEDAGNDPLRSLVLVFGMTPAENELSNRKGWIWPAAHSYDDWASVPQPQKDELLRLYTQEDLEAFARNGGYLGYRTSIDPEGRWLYFVAGD